MNKSELIDQLADRTGQTKTVLSHVVDALSKAVIDALKEGSEVTLPGLGKLHAAQRAARTGKNPKTGAPVYISASIAPKFKASKILKDALNKAS